MADLLSELKAKVLSINPTLNTIEVEDNAVALLTLFVNAGSVQTFTQLQGQSVAQMATTLNNLKNDGEKIEAIHLTQNTAAIEAFTGIIISSKS